MAPRNIVQRTFDSYGDYVYRQSSKARASREKLLKGIPRSVETFARVFTSAKPFLKDGPILCLGARTGAEMIAAVRLGFVGSVGIDLHPVGPGVLHGDWHQLTFDDGSFKNVYTNSFDHCLYLDRATSEIRRVLAPDGVFYLMASNKGAKTKEREAEWRRSQTHNEAIYWQHSDDLCAAVVAHGFRVLKSWHTGSWSHYILRPY